MNARQVLMNQIELIKPSSETLDNIKKTSERFCNELKSSLKKKKINADVFIGGSLAKDTIVKKNKYDVDIFVRFDKKYDNKKLSEILGRVLKKNAKKIHGSRDYYQIVTNGIVLEIVPVIKIKNNKEAKNITDLSYFHVKYIVDKTKKNPRLGDEIRLAKTFAYANNCYGAESYIKGFSGYALELLICYYGSFLKFCRAIVDNEITKEKKLIIDPVKFYKNQDEVLFSLNDSKVFSPIIVVDPTYSERNALAGLSIETLNKFKSACRKFLKNPSNKAFEKKEIKESFKKFKNLRVVSVKTNKQPGDIAGTKSKKFFDFFVQRVGREFNVKKSCFDYDEKKNLAYYFFVLTKKKDEKIKGPAVTNIDHLTRFKRVHKNAFIKNNVAYAVIKHNLSFDEFLKKFLEKDKKIIKDMCIKEIKKVS